MIPAPPAPLAPHLERWLEELRAIRRDAAALTDGVGEAQLAWRPGPGRWSIAEVVAHLNRAGRPYLDRIAHALAEARGRGPSPDAWRPTFVGGLMARSQEPPPRIRFRAPRIFRPGADGAAPPAGAPELATWRGLHQEMEERLREAAGVDLRRARIVSPVTGMVRMNAGDAFALLLSHERRHLWQIRGIRQDAGFPAA